MAESIAAHPLLSKLWDDKKNGTAASVLVRSFRPAWWRCENGHSFQRSPRSMLSDSTCPVCHRGATTNSIAKARPSLVPLWHPEKNGEQRPTGVETTHAGNCWWRCPRGHDFQRPPLLMLHDSSCPTCALAKSSLAAVNPAVASEWHPKRNGEMKPDQVGVDHMMSAWWLCPKGHEYQATVRSRAKGSKCPTCFGGWSLENIRAFVRSLLAHVGALNPSELFALAMQAGVLGERASRPFVMALSTGRFPIDELQKFADGKPSVVDDFAGTQPLTLEILELRQNLAAAKPADPYALPAAPVTLDEGGADIDVSLEVDATRGAEADGGDGALPVVQARDALAALDSVLVANADAETVKFLLDSAKAKLWRHAYVKPSEAREQAASFKGDAYSSIVRDRFLAEFDDAEALPSPEGYAFRPAPGAPITQPNLMQRRVAVCVRDSRRFGNWSGMGAGKTLSAILATRVVGAGLTMICCPNAVVDNWAIQVKNAFPRSEIASKTWHPTWSDPLESAPRYLVMNYEQF